MNITLGYKVLQVIKTHIIMELVLLLLLLLSLLFLKKLDLHERRTLVKSNFVKYEANISILTYFSIVSTLQPQGLGVY